MLIVKTKQRNSLVVTVSQNSTIPNPEWLFSFTHIFSKQQVRFIPTNISTSRSRYDEFEFIEGQGVGEIAFPYEGIYNYSILQQPAGSGNLNPSLSDGAVEYGQAVVIVTSADTTNDYYVEFVSNNEFNSNYIFAPNELNPPPTPTPTSTTTPTPTQTPTQTPTNTPTNTETGTPTPTPTNTETPTQTPTQTPTETPTNTPTNTETGTPTPTPTNTETPTETPTQTPTETSTPTPTPSATPPVSFDPDAAAYLQAVLTAGGTGITPTVSASTNSLFVSLKSNGLYDDITHLWLFLGGTAASHALESKLQSSFNINWFGGMSHNSLGSKGNNVNGYGDANVFQNSITQNNSYFSFYIPITFTDSSLDTMQMGCTPGYRMYASVAYNSSNTILHALGDSLNSQTTITNRQGFYLLNKNNPSNYQVYKNGSQISTINNGSTTPNPSFKYLLWSFALNGTTPWSTSFTNTTMNAIIFGKNMDATKQTTLYNLINTYETALGRNF